MGITCVCVMYGIYSRKFQKGKTFTNPQQKINAKLFEWGQLFSGSKLRKKILESPTFNAHQSSKLYGEGQLHKTARNSQCKIFFIATKFAPISHHGMNGCGKRASREKRVPG